MRLTSIFLKQAVARKGPPTFDIMLQQIPWFSGTRQVEEVLGKYGKIKQVHFLTNEETCTHSGKAFVRFEEQEAMKKALNDGKTKIDGFEVLMKKSSN